MTTPGAVIAEDEPLIRGEIRDLLAQLWPELAILAEVGDGIEALAALERVRPDVFFLDIQMPGLGGLEVAERLNGRAHVVFITTFDRYAVAAFEQAALDYVLKPVSLPRMRLAVERLRSRLFEPPADLYRIAGLLKELAPPESRYIKWLTVPHGAELRVVAAAEICYLRADQKCTTLVTPPWLVPHDLFAAPDEGETRPAGVLADSPQRGNQCRGHRQDISQLPRRARDQSEGPRRAAAGELRIRTSVSGVPVSLRGRFVPELR